LFAALLLAAKLPQHSQQQQQQQQQEQEQQQQQQLQQCRQLICPNSCTPALPPYMCAMCYA
jgi:hypothetical protein